MAKTLNGQTQVVVPNRNPKVKVYVPFMAYHHNPGARLLVTYRVFDGKKQVSAHQLHVSLAADRSVTFVAEFKPAKGKHYILTADVADLGGQHDKHAVALIPA